MPTHKIIVCGHGCLAAAFTQLTFAPHPDPHYKDYVLATVEIKRPNLACSFASAKGAITQRALDAFLERLYAALQEPQGPEPGRTGVGNLSVSIFWRGQHIQQQVTGYNGIVRTAEIVLALLPGFGLLVDESLYPFVGALATGEDTQEV
jgi:hypothetical protein